MEADRWRQIEEVFHVALQCDADARETYLASICGDDQLLLNEVKSLISSHELSGSFLDEPQFTAGLNLLAMHDGKSHAGETINHYVLQNRIGRGGMGDVYHARDQRLGRNVALKLLPASFDNHHEWVSRFQQEARAASSIAHPNIAHVYEVGESDGMHYIAMEYIEGDTLRERLKRGPLEPTEAINITIQVAKALGAAHAAGVLHRDIKPDNIMIHRDGYVKVLDFGLAKSAAGVGEQHTLQSLVNVIQTDPGIIIGSPAYMSPEQARGLQVDSRTDMWSLGVVLYELLTQKSPFLSETPSDTLAAVLKADPPPLGLAMPSLPKELDRIIARLLAKAPEDRYQSAKSLIDDLCGLAEEHTLLKTSRHALEVAVNFADTGAASSTPVARRPKRRPASLTSLPSSALAAAKPFKLRLAMIFVLIVTALITIKYINYSSPELHASPITSIAVLPSVNVNDDPSTEYVSDGLSESLIERFSRLSQLKVIARGSSFKYIGKAVEMKTMAQDLGVQAIVVISVVRLGDDLQISVELLDANMSNHLWSGQYQYKAPDLPSVLNDISRHVAAKLNLNLNGDELNLLTSDQTSEGDAYDWYLKGRYYWNQLTEEALNKSIDCFKKALEIDPQYALAYSGLANSYNTLGANYGNPTEQFPKAELNAQKALSLNGALPEAHYALAVTKYLYYWDMSSAEKELKRSLELNPNYAIANSLLCSLSLTKGDTKEALAYINRALELDPLSLLFNANLSYIYYSQRDNERAIKQIQKVLRQNPDASFAYNHIAKVYAQMGKFEDALAASQRATILMGQDPETLSSLGVVYALSGRTKEARWVTKTLEDLSEKKYVQAYLIASIYGALGDKDHAFIWLGKAGQQRSSYMLRFKVDPVFDKMRSDHRYDEILKAIHLV